MSKSRVALLKEEIQMAQKLNEEHLKLQMEEAIERYTGKHVPFIGQDWDIALNEIYPIIQFNIPSIYFRNPKVFLKPRNKTFIKRVTNPITGRKEEVFADASKSAHTQEHILNYILDHIKYKKEVQKVLLDALLAPFGVLWHGYKGAFGMTDEQSMFIKKESIFVRRISPMRFFKDPAVGMSDIDEGRWVARSFDVPLQDLQEDKSLNVSRDLKGKTAYGDRVKNRDLGLGGIDVLRAPDRSLISTTSKEFRTSSRSQFVEVFEVFERATPKEEREGKPGKVTLLSLDQKEPLRQSDWPYKAEGWPAKILEFNGLNDSQFGLPDVDTYKSIADQKNAIVNLQLRNAQENSKVWVAIAKDSGMGEEDIEKIRVGDQTVVLFPGETVQGKMQVASPSGMGSQELYIIDQRIQKNLEDKSGVTDLKRGFLQSGEESATSVKLRAAGSSVRPSYRQDIMSDFLKDSFGYINKLNQQFFTVKEAVRVVGSLDIEWSDNPSKEDIQAEVDIEIDAVSMLPESPEKELAELQQVLALMVQGINDPGVRQQLEKEGKTIELSPIIENLLMRLKIRNPNIFRSIRPEESEGFVSVSEMRAARANVEAALSNNPEMPSPPNLDQDHVGRTEVYASILGLIQSLGETQASLRLQELINIHQQLLQEEQKKESPRSGQPVRSPLGKQPNKVTL